MDQTWIKKRGSNVDQNLPCGSYVDQFSRNLDQRGSEKNVDQTWITERGSNVDHVKTWIKRGSVENVDQAWISRKRGSGVDQLKTWVRRETIIYVDELPLINEVVD